MGFTTPTLPDVDHDVFLAAPLMERVRIMTWKWVDQGYGVPRMIHVLYIAKLVLLYGVVGVTIATATSNLPAFWHVSPSTRRRSCGPCCSRRWASPVRGAPWRARPNP